MHRNCAHTQPNTPQFAKHTGNLQAREKERKRMAVSGTLERCRSREEGSESGMSARPISETTLSSFDSIVGEQLMSRVGGSSSVREWATSSLVGAASAIATTSKKKVMVAIDASRESRLAMLWALSHIVHSSDTVCLIQFFPSAHNPFAQLASSTQHISPQEKSEVKGCTEKLEARPTELGNSLKLLCTSRRPEVEVEVMMVEGMDKALTIVAQAKKLGANILVLGQKKPTLFQRLFSQRSPNDDVARYCIQHAECLTLAVRKKSKHMGGYLINSQWQKNFWLLA